jgi:EAL domain-containing protein (putative c-di-GMP-specific phosphodiesterase class I)
VAEGIETEDAFRLLESMGADIGQGYLMARPLTSRQLDEYLGHPDRVCLVPPLPAPLSVGT